MYCATHWEYEASLEPVELPGPVELPAAVEMSAAVERSAELPVELPAAIKTSAAVDPVAVAVLIPMEGAAMVAPATLPRPTPIVLGLLCYPTESTPACG